MGATSSFFMSLETTIFTFKICVPFEEWAAVYDSQENIQMNKDRGIVCLYKGVKKDDPTSVILIAVSYTHLTLPTILLV